VAAVGKFQPSGADPTEVRRRKLGRFAYAKLESTPIRRTADPFGSGVVFLKIDDHFAESPGLHQGVCTISSEPKTKEQGQLLRFLDLF
jgi:hypothetical protein